MFKRLISAGLSFGVAAIAPPALAAPCADRDTVVERLQSRYSEALTAGGLQSTQSSAMMVEVWASQESGTFTVIVTNPKGVSCVVAAGTDWFLSQPVAATSDTAS